MSPDSPRLSIDLGKKSNENASSVILKWTINSGKIIIVLIELLTLSALGFRFYIDRQITDIHEQIGKEQKFVSLQAKKETLFRNLQDRLTAIQTISMATEKQVAFVNKLTKIMNTDSFISSNVTTTPNGISIDGQVYSIFTLNEILEVIKANPDVASLSLDELVSQDQGIKFRLSTQFKQANIPM